VQRADVDLVIGDAFGGIAVPWHLATREFTADVATIVTPDGLYLLNVIDHGPRDFLRAEVATIADVFAHVAVLTRRGEPGGNHVVIASQRPLPLDGILAANRARGRDDTLVAGVAVHDLTDGARVLTDDRAPVDQLLTPMP
jgi:spermidine synthase